LYCICFPLKIKKFPLAPFYAFFPPQNGFTIFSEVPTDPIVLLYPCFPFCPLSLLFLRPYKFSEVLAHIFRVRDKISLGLLFSLPFVICASLTAQCEPPATKLILQPSSSFSPLQNLTLMCPPLLFRGFLKFNLRTLAPRFLPEAQILDRQYYNAVHFVDVPLTSPLCCGLNERPEEDAFSFVLSLLLCYTPPSVPNSLLSHIPLCDAVYKSTPQDPPGPFFFLRLLPTLTLA